MTVFLMLSCVPLVTLTLTPFVKWAITQSSMFTDFGPMLTTLTPLRPKLHEVPTPLMEMPRIVTKSVAATFMVKPLVLDAKVEANVPVPSRVIDLVIVSAPKPPGSRASISPQAAVFEMAPAQVLHGAVRLHGLTSSPTPDTQVRVACAWVREANANIKVAIASILIVNRNLFIWSLLFFC